VALVGVLGNLSRDRLATGRRVGGAPFHCARALAALDVDAVVLTKAAEADADLVEELAALGVPIVWRPSSATSAFGIEYVGDDRRMVVEALGQPWTADEVRGWIAEALGGAGWVHVGPLARSDFPAETLAELARTSRVSYDGQGLVRPARTGELVLDTAYDPELLRSLAILKLSEEEAAVLGTVDLGVPEVLVTLGARGAVVHADGRTEEVGTRALDGVDPTGAGDMFAAAYVAARARGEAPVAAAASACSLVAEQLA
jgi:sugar/nucleoside kinase (ribokinase family)